MRWQVWRSLRILCVSGPCGRSLQARYTHTSFLDLKYNFYILLGSTVYIKPVNICAKLLNIFVSLLYWQDQISVV